MASTKKTTTTKAPETKKVAPAKVVRKATTAVKAEAEVVTKPVASKTIKGIKADVFDLNGKVTSSVELPASLFAAKINKPLMVQAVQVYLANQRKGTQSTKTRSEVTGSTRKIYRQKGTGRARHGGITAPIFVGGGIALGPKPRDFSRSLSQKMRRAALASSLTVKRESGMVRIVDGLDKIEPKTKRFVEALTKLELDDKKKKVLLVLAEKNDNLQKAARNVEGVTFVLANQLNTYEVLNAKNLLMLRSAVETLEKTFGAKENK